MFKFSLILTEVNMYIFRIRNDYRAKKLSSEIRIDSLSDISSQNEKTDSHQDSKVLKPFYSIFRNIVFLNNKCYIRTYFQLRILYVAFSVRYIIL